MEGCVCLLISMVRILLKLSYQNFNSEKMSLCEMCIHVLVKPKVLEMYKNLLSLIPISVKIRLLKILCKRGWVRDPYIFKQLVNSKVTEMDLSECEMTDDLLSCLYVCKNLQKLDISLRRRQTRFITKKVLSSLVLNFPHLKILAIPYCEEVNDDVIKAISENCTQLRELHIPHSSITDLSLYYIGQNLCHLSVINFLGTQISDIGMQYLTNGPLSKSLTEINIDKCPNISPYFNSIVAEKCINIKIFTCGNCISCDNNEELALAMNGIRLKAKQVFWSI